MTALADAHDPWPDRLADAGLLVSEPLGSGMDGTVYALDDGSVVKVWFRQEHTTLERLAACYADLAAAGLPFATPEIASIHRVADTLVTVERRLLGTPLPTFDQVTTPPPAGALRTFVDVLAALREVPATPAMRALGVMDEDVPAYAAEDQPFPLMLAGLLERRVAAYADQLDAAVPDFGRVLDAVRAGLRALPTDRAYADRVIHGDLCPPNLLVAGEPSTTADGELTVLSVLDWGFLSTAGDPAFDAALACGFFDMYGPRASTTDATLTGLVVDAFGYAVERMHLYRAVYAIVGANAYSPTGGDGHFEWCAAQLGRADIRTALGL